VPNTIHLSESENQIKYVSNFHDLVQTPFEGNCNAICWNRTLEGDFSEIVQKIELSSNMVVISEEELLALELSEQGKLALSILLNDLKLLSDYGASPILNLIQNYERDADYPFFPTDVYSFHVDRSPIPTDTFLCTYYGQSSEIVPNAQAEQKVLVPAIRRELRKLYTGKEEGFEAFLSEHFFDLHYQAKPNAPLISLGLGNMWRLAVDHPESKVLPCVHRAPLENNGEPRLLLIC
jgi:hypothetical protein